MSHLELAGVVPPKFRGAVPIQFDAVLVGVADIHRLAHAVIDSRVDFDMGGLQPLVYIRQIRARRVEERDVKQARCVRLGRLAIAALPGVDADVMMSLGISG